MSWPYDELIEKIYLPCFHKQGEGIIPFLVNGAISKAAFLSAYKKLPPIEKMPNEEKHEMKQYARALFPNKTPQEKLDACKIIYTIGSIL